MEMLTLAGYVLAVCAAASTGAMFPPGDWYDRLAKPGWTPPNWLFPLAWTALYAMLVYVAWRLTRLPMEAAAVPLAFWSAQIALNAVWTPVFMGLHKLGAALVVLALMWLSVVALTVAAFAVDWLSGLLLIPYVIWTSYAGALNAAIWRANRAAA